MEGQNITPDLLPQFPESQSSYLRSNEVTCCLVWFACAQTFAAEHSRLHIIQEKLTVLSLLTTGRNWRTGRFPVHTVAPPATTPNQPQPKLQTLPRPEFTLGMSEAAWDFVKMKWEAYIGQVSTTPDQKLLQLKAACSPELLQRWRSWL